MQCERKNTFTPLDCTRAKARRWEPKMIVLNVSIFIIYIILWIISRGYEKDLVNKLDVKQYKMKQFYSLGLYFTDKLSKIKYFNKANEHFSKLDDPLKALYVGENLNLVKRLYRCNKIVFVLLIVFVSNLLAFGSDLKANLNRQLIDGKYIGRPGYNEGTKTVLLDVRVSEDQKTLIEEEIPLEVEEKRYDDEELNKMFSYAKEYIDAHILNNNESAEKIHTQLNFMSRIPETRLSVKWITGDHEILDEKGRVHNEELTEGVVTWVTAVITYYEKQQEYTRYFRILPKVYSKEEIVRNNLSDALNEMADQSQTEEKLILPNVLEQQQVSWAEKESNSGTMFILLGSITAFFLYVLMDRDLFGKVEKRNREMLIDYPEIINKFTLLVGAGMSLSNVWIKISQDYKEKGLRKRYAYEEMMITYGELMIGTSEIVAYERFGRRVKLLPYLRFSSLIAQNVKKGSAGLLGQLELEAVEAFEERKELAKRMGEEAGTKLLVPMMLMLMIVLAIIIVPAFISFAI